MRAKTKPTRIPRQGHKRRFKKPRSKKMKENTTFVRPGQAATGTTGSASGGSSSGAAAKGGGKGSSGGTGGH